MQKKLPNVGVVKTPTPTKSKVADQGEERWGDENELLEGRLGLGVVVGLDGRDVVVARG
jgi:hypothetical protein